MPRFFLVLSVGPVQSLIADARRTRDLWGGSWLLSEAARAAARKLHEIHPGCLVFPCPANPDDELQPQDRPRAQDAPPGIGAERHRGGGIQPRHAPRETANIANILRADVALADGAAIRALCDEAKRAAALRVEELAERALRRVGSPLCEEVWRAQIDDILECFAAWVEIADEDDGYMNAGRRLGGAINARKATRDFEPCRPLSGKPLPKSSLDGARETVLPRTLAAGSARKLRLSPGEPARRPRRHQASGRRRGAVHRSAAHRGRFVDRAAHTRSAATVAGGVRAAVDPGQPTHVRGQCRRVRGAAVRRAPPVSVQAGTCVGAGA